MRRLISASVVVSMFCLTGLAGAEDKRALSLNAILKTDTSTGSELSFVFVTGESLYADGTKIFVGVQALDSTRYLRVVHAIVEKGHFLAEIGPWEQHFPPGHYHVVAEFRYEDQSEALQHILNGSRDIETCMKDNEEYRKFYYKQNPERARRLEDYIARTGRCPGKTGFGEAWLDVGSPEDIDRADALELGRILGFTDVAEKLATEVAAPGGPTVPAEWRAELEGTQESVRKERAGVVCSRHIEAWQELENALMNLGWCGDDQIALTTGAGAAFQADVAELSGKEGADKDERRRLAKAKSALAAMEKTRAEHVRTAVTALTEALFGKNGLEPAPARAKKFETDLLGKFGLQPE
ncbi:MAG: hypothetical protein K8T20_13190 [Planctomycetes bacterium]|nr:hypothetical protein [Planctomycetota bacterium]